MEPISDLLARHPWAALLLQCTLAALVGLALHGVGERILRRAGRRFALSEKLVQYTRRPAQLLIPLLLVHLTLVEAQALGGVRRVLSIAVILLVTFIVIRLVAAVADRALDRYPTEVEDNLYARSVHTQVRVLSRTAMFVVALLGLGSLLMTFPHVRQIGASLLASAGVAGIVAGIAARPVLGNLIAGLQIALTQPIRIDDVLIVENEWGRVEEITMTYVVVRIWDDRRLIVPLEYFIQNPFQNWTRRTSHLLGSAFFWVDYRMPVERVREVTRRIVEAAPEWDGRVCVVQVTDFSERAMQLRVLVSTQDAGLAWDLRCRVREELIAFMQEEFPEALPRLRAAVDGGHRDAHGEDGARGTRPRNQLGGAQAPA